MEQLNPNTKIQDGEHSYTLQEYIGAGSYGEVWKAVNDATGEEVAIKFYIMLDERGREEFMSEYQIAYGLYHKNLLTASFMGTWENRPFLVMRYCSKGSAAHLVGKLEPNKENENLIWRFIRDVASGLACLHSQEPDPIVHQDIKPDNILIDNDDNFVITDFGISKKIRSTMRSQSNRSAKAGAVAYMGPERFSSHPTPIMASDIWSLGASIYEIAMGELPFYGQGGNMLRNGADMPEVDGRWSEDLKNVIYLCLAKEPWDRIKAYELEEFAQNILDCRLAGGADFDPRKTQRKVEAPVPPVPPAPVFQATPNPEPAAPKKKKNHRPLIITLSLLLLAGGGFALWFFSTANKRHAHSMIEPYQNFVAECRMDIENGSASNYTFLFTAREVLDSIAAYDIQYSSYYPDVFCEYFPLAYELNAKMEEASNAWVKAARSQNNIGNYGNAADYYRLALNLQPYEPSDSTSLRSEVSDFAETVAYMKIEKIEVKFYDKDEKELSDSESLYADNIQKVDFYLVFDGILDYSVDTSVDVDFYGGWSGSLYKEVELTVPAYDSTVHFPNSEFLTAWGYSGSEHFSPGTYTVKVRKDNRLLAEKTFYLK